MEYAQILSDARPKFLEFTSTTNNIITVVDRILGDRLASEINVMKVYSLVNVPAEQVAR